MHVMNPPVRVTERVPPAWEAYRGGGISPAGTKAREEAEEEGEAREEEEGRDGRGAPESHAEGVVGSEG